MTLVLRPGDLIFCHGSSLVDRIIQFVTRSKYNHAAIYIGNGQVMEAQGFRTVGIQSLSFYAGQYDVYRIPMSNAQLLSGLMWLKHQEGVQYDYWDIFVLFMRCVFRLTIPWHECHRLICSRLGRDFLFQCKIPIPDQNMTPEDLAEWVKLHGYQVSA